MSIETLSRRCSQVPSDSLECDLVAGTIYIGAYVAGEQNDIAITAETAREFAEWLERAALVAEQSE
jgi:hypothetical protein